MCNDAAETLDNWFLNLVFAHVLKRHADPILMGQIVPKFALCRGMLQWRRWSKREVRTICTFLAKRYPGVRFTNRGLFVPDAYLKWALECPSCRAAMTLTDRDVDLPTHVPGVNCPSTISREGKPPSVTA